MPTFLKYLASKKIARGKMRHALKNSNPKSTYIHVQMIFMPRAKEEVK